METKIYLCALLKKYVIFLILAKICKLYSVNFNPAGVSPNDIVKIVKLEVCSIALSMHNFSAQEGDDGKNNLDEVVVAEKNDEAEKENVDQVFLTYLMNMNFRLTICKINVYKYW